MLQENYIGSVPAEEYLSSAPKIHGGIVRCYDTGDYFIWTGSTWEKYQHVVDIDTSSKATKTKVCLFCGNPSAIIGTNCLKCKNMVTNEN